MDTKKFLIGTLSGTVTSFAASFLIFGLALKSYLSANASVIDSPAFHWIILGQVLFAGLLSYIFLRWTGIKSLAGGAKAGAVIGLFVALGYNLILLGSTSMFSGGLSAAVVDALGSTLVWITAGAGVGWALGREKGDS